VLDRVGILGVLTSPYWQRIAGSLDADDAPRLYRCVATNGLTRGDPAQNIPLRGWITKLRAETIRQQNSNLAQDNDKTIKYLLPST
jgi:hypothetical protein